jgi:hypothetical protein
MYLLYHVNNVILLVKYARASETTWVHISGVATGGRVPPPTILLQNHLRDMFKSVEKLGGGNTDPIFS